MIQVSLVGDWAGAQRAINQLPFKVREAARQGQGKAAKELLRIVKGHINNQDLGWPALSEYTDSRDPRTLVDTKAYYKAMETWESKGVFFTGVKRSSFDGQGRRIADYAILHETGTINMPARPLWGPSMKELGGTGAVRNFVLLAIYQKIQSMRLKGFDIDFKL